MRTSHLMDYQVGHGGAGAAVRAAPAVTACVGAGTGPAALHAAAGSGIRAAMEGVAGAGSGSGAGNDADDSLACWLADAAVGALIDEATLTPKPGLVDLRGSGSHDDLNWLLMCHSARALHPAFHAMALAGRRIADAPVLRDTIGAQGRDAERAMLRATGGVNTHRGAIWALGLLVTAAAQPGACHGNAASVAERAGALARLPDRHAPAVTGNKGALACLQHGVGGARLQAQQGFPHVVNTALPTLHASRLRGGGETAARLNALLAVMAQLDDTCLLARGGRPALEAAQQGAQRVLAAGGAAHGAGQRALRLLDADLLARRVSPGGAADLLAAALLLDRIAHRVPAGEREMQSGSRAGQRLQEQRGERIDKTVEEQDGTTAV